MMCRELTLRKSGSFGFTGPSASRGRDVAASVGDAAQGAAPGPAAATSDARGTGAASCGRRPVRDGLVPGLSRPVPNWTAVQRLRWKANWPNCRGRGGGPARINFGWFRCLRRLATMNNARISLPRQPPCCRRIRLPWSPNLGCGRSDARNRRRSPHLQTIDSIVGKRCSPSPECEIGGRERGLGHVCGLDAGGPSARPYDVYRLFGLRRHHLPRVLWRL